MKIEFIAVGGTIDKIYFDQLSTYQVGPPGVDKILQEARVNFDYDILSLLKKDSLDMTETDREMIVDAVANIKSKHIVITHGTDTMAETAAILKKIPGKTIVLTGAMEPACFKSSDAPFNLGGAVAAVQTLPPGVYISINGRIFNPDNVRKNRSLKQFQEKNDKNISTTAP